MQPLIQPALRLSFIWLWLATFGWLQPVAAEPLATARPQAWERYAVAAPLNPMRLPAIAIVIDDVGVNVRQMEATLALPGQITIAVLPYAPNAAQLAREARARGHEVMLHLPMQPLGAENPGPHALTVSLSPAEFDRRLAWNLAQLDGYVGVNNHMGSRLTSDRPAMTKLLDVLRQRGLLFLDSRTGPRSVGTEISRSKGVPNLQRDIFLDHVITPENIRRQLQLTEAVARRNGFAIAIGHPHPATLAALNRWALDLEARGFKLAPLSAMLNPERPLRSAALGGLK